MSRSKRALPAPTVQPSRGQGFRGLFVKNGRVRGIWLLSASLLAWLTVSLGVRLGLRLGFDALFRAWNLTADNVHRAPDWARTLYVWHGSLISLFDAIAVIALSFILRRAWRCKSETARFRLKPALVAGLVGAGFALLSAGLFVLTDSLRLDWPLTRPNLTAGLPALALIALMGTLAEEAFTKAVIYDGLADRWGRLWAAACAVMVSFVVGGGWAGGVIGAVNALLLGGLCCMLYERHGLWPPVLLRWGFGFCNMFLLGFGGGASAVYSLYGVSEHWLTGSDAGLACGLWLTAALTVPLMTKAIAQLKKGSRQT